MRRGSGKKNKAHSHKNDTCAKEKTILQRQDGSKTPQQTAPRSRDWDDLEETLRNHVEKEFSRGDRTQLRHAQAGNNLAGDTIDRDHQHQAAPCSRSFFATEITPSNIFKTT